MMIGIGLGLPMVGRGGGAPFDPASLFAGGAEGWIYDPSDLSTLFQDSAGTTPVTAPGDPVGLVLDKSQGLVLGPQRVINGGFDADANWTKGTGWTISGGVAASDGSQTGNSNLSQFSIVTSGTLYKVEFDVVTRTAGSVRILIGGSGRATPTYTTAGSKVAYVLADGGGVFVQADANFVGSIDNISVRELPGHHATQETGSFQARHQTAPPRLVFDGADDRYLTGISPTSTGGLAVRMRGGTASRVAIGAQPATNGRCYIGLAADGSLAGGIGTQATSTIKGTTSKIGAWVTGVLTWDGSTVTLYEDGVSVYSAAQSGAVATTVPFFLGALNANGTATGFWDDDISDAIAINRAITAQEAAALHTIWSS